MRLLRGILIGLGLGFLVSRLSRSKSADEESLEREPALAPEPLLEPDNSLAGRASRMAYAVKEQFRYAWREASQEADQREEELLEEFRNYSRKDKQREKRRGLFRRRG